MSPNHETTTPEQAAMEALPEFVRGHRLAYLADENPEEPEYSAEQELLAAGNLYGAEVITSWTGDREAPPVTTPMDWSALAEAPETFHRPVLDLDFPAVVVPSSTAGHGHLYLDKVLTWSQYVKLLEVLAEVGILEPGYVSASIAREFTSVRLPWVRKPAPDKLEATPAPVEPEISVRPTWLDGRGF